MSSLWTFLLIRLTFSTEISDTCSAGGCDSQDDLTDDMVALQVKDTRKREEDRASKDEDDVSEDEFMSEEEEEDEFLRELYRDGSQFPTEEDWWIPMERKPAYIQKFHYGNSPPPFENAYDAAVAQSMFGTKKRRRHRKPCGSCKVNEEGVNLFWETCVNESNSCCGKGCYLWNYPCKHADKDVKTVYYSDLVMPKVPLIGVEMITLETAPLHDHLWPDAGHWMTPALPDPPYVLELSSKYGWAHILNPYTARTSHQMHIAVRQLSKHGISLVRKLDKKLKCKTGVWVSQKVGMCKMGQAQLFDTVPAGFSIGLRRAIECNGCLGELLVNPRTNITTMGTIGVTLLYTDKCGGDAVSLMQEDENLDEEEEEDEEAEEEDDDVNSVNDSDDDGRPHRHGRGRGPTKAPVIPKSKEKARIVKPIMLYTSNGKKACSIKYSIS